MGSPVRPRPERPVPPRPAGSAAVALGLLFVALAAAVRAGAGPLLRADLRVVDACHARVLPRPWLHHLFEVLAAVTAPNTWRAVAAVAAAALWLRGRRPAAARLVVMMAAGGVVGMVLKLLVARDRPSFPVPLATVDGYSFPSGHALNSMLFAASVLLLVPPAARRRTRITAWAAAAATVLVTGLDRIGLGVHYPSDVLGGWLAALATVAAVAAAFALPRRRAPGSPPPQAG